MPIFPTTDPKVLVHPANLTSMGKAPGYREGHVQEGDRNPGPPALVAL